MCAVQLNPSRLHTRHLTAHGVGSAVTIQPRHPEVVRGAVRQPGRQLQRRLHQVDEEDAAHIVQLRRRGWDVFECMNLPLQHTARQTIGPLSFTCSRKNRP